MTFEWNADDVAKILASMFKPGEENYKFLDLPLANYGSSSFDHGRPRTASWSACRCSPATATTSAPSSRSARSMRTSRKAIMLTLVWGEPNGGTKKLSVEPHKQMEVRVRVAPVPYSGRVRETYASGGWRAHGTAA